VAARPRRGGQGLLDLLHRLEQRNPSLFVVVDADAQVDLGGTGIGVVRLGQAQDRVAGDQFDVREEGHGLALRWRETVCGARGTAPAKTAQSEQVAGGGSTASAETVRLPSAAAPVPAAPPGRGPVRSSARWIR